MTARHRGALIGCGFFARNHMNGWAGQPGVEIVALCDSDRSKAEAFARDFGGAVYTDAATMLGEVKPDFADIATTVPSHRPLVELAARHARLVICQKPFAETLQDAAAMVAACDRTGAVLMVHENFRWQLPFRVLKTALEEGQIGTPRFLRLSFRHGFDIYRNQPYLTEVDDLALTDIGLHLFDQARFLMGDVLRVACETQRRNPMVRGQDAFTATLRHTSGAVTVADASFCSTLSPDPFPQTLAVVEGDDGTLELVEGYRLLLHRRDGTTETEVDPPVPAWGERPWHCVQDSVAAFEAHAIRVLDGLDQPQPSGRHNLETLAVTLAAIRAAATGQTVRIADILAEGA